MKKFIFLILTFLLFLNINLFAADSTNCTVNWVEFDNAVLYYGPATFPAAAGTDNTFSQAMAIDFIDREADVYSWLQCYFTEAGAEDANGYVTFSNTLTAATYSGVATDADLDALTTTIVFDTVGVAEGSLDYLKGTRYLRLKFDGQTGNPNGSVVNWYLWIPKAPGAPSRGCAGAYDTS